MPAALMHHETDPATEIFAELGDISNVDLYFSSVLVAVYLRPEKTKSGIYYSDKTRDEDRYQGKVGLVVKIGPRAFVDDGEAVFHGQTVNVGDWVVYRPSDGWNVTINKRLCRILNDVDIKARVPAPDVIW